MNEKTTSHESRRQRLAVAKTIIAEAGTLALDYFTRLESLTVERKTSGQDTVSEADRNVETAIRNAIMKAFPEDGLWGEEHGRADGRSGYSWVIDPIDGTTVFLHGIPNWTVVIAILENGRPVIGLVLVPAQGKLYWAAEGEGAWCNDRPIHVDTTSPVDSGLFVVGPGAAQFSDHVGGIVTRIMAAGSMFIRFGSAAHSLALVASGHLLGFYEPRLSAWDCLAGLLLIREAGGRTQGFAEGSDWSIRQPVIGVSAAVEDEFLSLIGPIPEPQGHP